MRVIIQLHQCNLTNTLTAGSQIQMKYQQTLICIGFPRTRLEGRTHALIDVPMIQSSVKWLLATRVNKRLEGFLIKTKVTRLRLNVNQTGRAVRCEVG
ncbi:hypothetical protein scyTo_0000553 [Scyliorhinus torazame]|uniref:Uncharacterized protein n=1 Tax=Scyliorhinus torazame TaxID=75743 RepID=A0A401NZ32_SCYTO|nr:hypothetical protein [Scyliorhinus torazame]